MQALRNDQLVRIHTTVYARHGYNLTEGLKAFRRGRRWAETHTPTDTPPKGIRDKLLLWAEVNKSIQIALIHMGEQKKNAEQHRPKTVEEQQSKKVICIPER